MKEFSLLTKKTNGDFCGLEMGAYEMEYELEDIELKAVKLEEVERDYVEFRREMGEEQTEK